MKNLFSKIFRKTPSSNQGVSLRADMTAAAQRLRETIADAIDVDARREQERALAALLASQGICPLPTDSPAVWVSAVCTATDKVTALDWLKDVQGDEWLQRIAVQARAAETRLSAAKRMTDLHRIRDLAEQVRTKDKGVYRHCTAVLKASEKQHRRAEQIEAKLNALGHMLNQCPLPAGQLYVLRQDIAAMDDGDDLAACRGLLEQARVREQEEGQQLRQLDKAMQRGLTLLQELEHAPWPWAERMQSWRESAQLLKEDHKVFPDWLVTHKLALELTQVIRAIDAKLNAFAEDDARMAAAEQFLSAHEGEAITEAFTSAWESLSKPGNSMALAQLQARRESLSALPPPQVKPPRIKPSPATLDLAAIRQHIEALAQAIEDGSLRTAMTLTKQIDALAAGSNLPRSLADSYNHSLSQLGRLRDWASWSGRRVRDELVDAAEALLDESIDIARRTEEVPKLRAEWKRLDQQAPPSRAQRERFDRALAQAYAPVLLLRAERTEQMKAARHAREDCLASWESWLNGVNWEAPDFAEVQRQRRALRNQWRALPRGSVADERRLNTRCDAIISAIDRYLDPVIAQEFDRRERLIAAAQRLQEANLAQALTQARSLQQRWREEAGKVQLPRKQSDDQWQRFRGTIDQIFTRRDAERLEQADTLRQQTEARQAVLTAFSDCISRNPGLSQLEQALTTFRGQWDVAQASSERRQHDALDRQATELIRRAEGVIRTLQLEKQRELFTVLADKSALAENLEFAAATHQAIQDRIQEIDQAWQTLPELPSEAERAMCGRLHRATDASQTDLETGHAMRADQLIDLEIFVDLPTPAEFSQQRQGRQLGLLQSGFHRQKTPEQILTLVINWYATTAAADASQLERIKAVTQKLAERLLPDTAATKRKKRPDQHQP